MHALDGLPCVKEYLKHETLKKSLNNYNVTIESDNAFCDPLLLGELPREWLGVQSVENYDLSRFLVAGDESGIL